MANGLDASVRMKILVATRFPVGGIRSFLRYVYSQPVFDDCEISLLAPSGDLGDCLAHHIPSQRLKVQNVPGAPRLFLRETRAALKTGRFDLLHTHGLTTGVIGEIARTGSNTPHLMTLHDMFRPNTFKGLRGRAQQLGLNLLMRRCDAIHAVSQDCASNFLEYLPLVKRERVHAILSGIDTDSILNAVPFNAHAELGLPLDIKLIGFFGRFMAPKGFRTLVDAVEILAQSKNVPQFRVVTFGWGGFIREDYQYLKDKGLAEYFVQQPHSEEPYRWMKAMDLIAMPSRWEACGLVAMEAIVAGTPIVASNCVGLREVTKGTPAVIAEVDDPGDLARCLRHVLLNDPRSLFTDYQAHAVTRFAVAGKAEMLHRLVSQNSRRSNL